MKKLIFFFAIVLFTQFFTSCSTDIEDETNQIEHHQSDDYGEDDVIDEDNAEG